MKLKVKNRNTEKSIVDTRREKALAKARADRAKAAAKKKKK